MYDGNVCYKVVLSEIEICRKLVPYAEKGDSVGLITKTISKEKIKKGMIASSEYNSSKPVSSILQLSEQEQQYLDNLKEFLEDDAEITPRERKMLDRIRQSLGISEERAKELEASLTPQLTEDEQEYIDMYREYAEKGEITEKERNRLKKFATALGISEERVKELES